jgi:hypothetical protein
VTRAILLRHPAFVPDLEYARAEYDRSLAYLRFVLSQGHGEPDHPLRVDAAYARRDQALKERHAAEGW